MHPKSNEKYITFNRALSIHKYGSGNTLCPCCGKMLTCPNSKRSDHRPHYSEGWQIVIKDFKGKKKWTKSFSFKRYKSRKKALQAAIECRNKILKEEKQEWRLLNE